MCECTRSEGWGSTAAYCREKRSFRVEWAGMSSRLLSVPERKPGLTEKVFDGLDVGQENDTAALAERLEAGADPLELLGSVEGP